MISLRTHRHRRNLFFMSGDVPSPGWYPDPLGGLGARRWDGSAWVAPFPEPEPPAREPAPAPSSRRRWLVPAGVSVAVIAAAVGATLLTLRTAEKPVAAPSPVTITSLVPSPPPPSPILSPTEIAQVGVKVSMQEKLDSDPDLKSLRLTVVDVILVHKSGNEFKGIVHIQTKDDVVHDVQIDVMTDGQNMMWQTPPGSFNFVYDDVKPSPPPAAQLPGAGPIENFTVCPSGLSGVASDETSCAFADNVHSSWYSSPDSAVMVYSPVTHQSYLMYCIPVVTEVWPEAKRCVGRNTQGAMLIVYID